MKINKVYKFKLVLEPIQKEMFDRWAAICVYVYNYYLDQRIKRYKETKEQFSCYDQCRDLTQLKKKLPWLKEVQSQVLQQVLRDLELAYKSFFRRVKSGDSKPGFPRFKDKHFKLSFRLPQINNNLISCYKRSGLFSMPKAGIVKFVPTRKMDGIVKNVTLIRECNKWYGCFNCEVELPERPKAKVKEVEIKFGIEKPILILSDGTIFKLPLRRILYYERKIASASRKLARQCKSSKRWQKQKDRLAKYHAKITAMRKDWHHKVSTIIVKKYDVIKIDKLDLKGMTKREPREKKPIRKKNCSQKTLYKPNLKIASSQTNLCQELMGPPNATSHAKISQDNANNQTRLILRNAWHRFKVFLEYKAKWHNKTLIENHAGGQPD